MEINGHETEMVGRAIHNLSAVAQQPVIGPVASIMLQNITKPGAKSVLKIWTKPAWLHIAISLENMHNSVYY